MIDDLISKTKKIAIELRKTAFNTRCSSMAFKRLMAEAEEYEQIAEGLDKLKELGSGTIISSGEYPCHNRFKEGKEIGYKKAIDDATNKLYKEFLLNDIIEKSLSELKQDKSNDTQLDFKELKMKDIGEEELQKLKELVNKSPVTIVSTSKNEPSVELIDEQSIRNKAIDDFVNNCSEYYFNVDDSPFRPYLRDINIISQPNIERIAKQLKAGGAE